MKTYSGSCHCGKVKFSFKSEHITSGLVCNCSICEKKGATMSDFVISANDLQVSGKEHLNIYQFDTKVAKHYFCSSCGIYPFHETLRMPGSFRVNLGCVEGVDTNALEITLFDGKNLI